MREDRGTKLYKLLWMCWDGGKCPFYVRDVLERENQRYKQALEDIRDISTGSPHKFAVKALEEGSE